MTRFAVLGFLAVVQGGTTAAVEGPATCGAMKDLYRTNACCGDAAKAVSVCPVCNACPYDFTKPACADAEVQAPRDLSTGAVGTKVAKAATLNAAQADKLPLTNVHYHLGAEHKSSHYAGDAASLAYDALHHRRLSGASSPRPGYFCDASGLTAEESKHYSFLHCKGDVAVGKTYEVHYVHSSAGYDGMVGVNAFTQDMMDDGLGGAANGRGQLNPMVVVQAQVFQIVSGGPIVADMLHGWSGTNPGERVMYPGSTTGPSHDNDVCSPYAVTWHVDKGCHKVSPESFDNLCKQMKENYNLDGDLAPHGSRKIVASSFVVPESDVLPLA